MDVARSMVIPMQGLARSTPTTASEGVRDASSSSDVPSLSSSSEDSFHTVHSRVSNPEPSALEISRPSSPSSFASSQSSGGYQLAMPHLPQQEEHDPSSITPLPGSPRQWNVHETPSASDDDAESSSAPPATPGLISDVDDTHDEERSEAVTPASRPCQWNRDKATGPPPSPPPTLSPRTSHPSHLFTTSSSGVRLTKAIIHTTCLLMFSTPAQLIDMMVSIARKVVNGMLGGVVIGISEGGQRIPCEWEFSDSDDDEDHEGEGQIWDENSHIVKFSDMTTGHSIRRRDVGEACELD